MQPIVMQLRAGVRPVAGARPVRAFSAGSAYLGCRIAPSQLQGVARLPARRRGAAAARPVTAAFLGVGAPEAILVGVVALVVFGPKGLAQAAKSLGATLRSFAPTIREITSVSQELKSTLEQEIGINEIKQELNRPAVPQPRAPADGAADASPALGELADSMAARQGAAAAEIDPDIERKRAEAAAAAWGGAAPAAAAPAAPAAAPAAAAAAAAAPAAAAAQQQQQQQQPSAAAGKPRAVEAMSLEELEAELQRRKAAVAGGQLPPTLSAADDAPRQA